MQSYSREIPASFNCYHKRFIHIQKSITNQPLNIGPEAKRSTRTRPCRGPHGQDCVADKTVKIECTKTRSILENNGETSIWKHGYSASYLRVRRLDASSKTEGGIGGGKTCFEYTQELSTSISTTIQALWQTGPVPVLQSTQPSQAVDEGRRQPVGLFHELWSACARRQGLGWLSLCVSSPSTSTVETHPGGVLARWPAGSHRVCRLDGLVRLDRLASGPRFLFRVFLFIGYLNV